MNKIEELMFIPVNVRNDTLCSELEFIYKEYGLEADERLDNNARKLKQAILTLTEHLEIHGFVGTRVRYVNGEKND